MMTTSATASRPTITQVNIYRAGGEWCYAASTADGYDHSDGIDAGDEATADAAVRAMFPAATIERVGDVTADGRPI